MSSQRSSFWKKANFDAPRHRNNVKVCSDATPCQFRLPHKSSQFRSLHWSQVNGDPPHLNQVFLDPHNKQVNFYVTCRFSACFFACCYTYGYTFLLYTNNTYHIYGSRIIFDVSLIQQNPWKIGASKYLVPHYFFYYMVHFEVYINAYDTGGRTSLPSMPPLRSILWCHAQVGAL